MLKAASNPISRSQRTLSSLPALPMTAPAPLSLAILAVWLTHALQDADLDYEGKRVVVIGSGATAVTLVPELAKKAAHVTMLQRSPLLAARTALTMACCA